MGTRSTISAVLIVKNEQKHLEQCLNSVATWVDEIIIVDSGSTDDTLIIAKKFTDKVYVHESWPGFGPQRQLAQSYATSDWVFVLDADEVVSDQLKVSIIDIIKNSTLDVCYEVNRLSKAFGKYIRHSGWSPDWIVRLYPRKLTRYNGALVHEKVITLGIKTIKIKEGYLFHNTYENLYHYSLKTTGYLKAWSDEREGKKTSSVSKALLHALACFLKMYFIKLGFLDGRHGFVLAWLAAHSTFYKYIDLWLRERNRNES